MPLDELDVRRSATAYVAEQPARAGGVISRANLEAFTYEVQQPKLIDQSRGIRNPRELTATFSVLSSPRGPYDDVDTEDWLLRYAYRGGNPNGGTTESSVAPTRWAYRSSCYATSIQACSCRCSPSSSWPTCPRSALSRSPWARACASSHATQERTCGRTRSGSPSCDCTRRCSGLACCGPTTRPARSVGSSA